MNHGLCFPGSSFFSPFASGFPEMHFALLIPRAFASLCCNTFRFFSILVRFNSLSPRERKRERSYIWPPTGLLSLLCAKTFVRCTTATEKENAHKTLRTAAAAAARAVGRSDRSCSGSGSSSTCAFYRALLPWLRAAEITPSSHEEEGKGLRRKRVTNRYSQKETVSL